MRPAWHVAAGIGLGGVIYQVSASWQLASVSAATEVFMDLDHALEHILRSDRPFCVKTFFSRNNSLDWPKIVFAFHAYEWVIVLAALSAYYDLPVMSAAALGAAVHLILDEIGNRRFMSPGHLAAGFYFLSYRLYRRFETKDLIHEAAGYPRKIN